VRVHVIFSNYYFSLIFFSDALLSLNFSLLTEDSLHLLTKTVPTNEEVTIVKAYSGDVEALGNVERFFLLCSSIPNIQTYIASLLYMRTYAQNTRQIEEWLCVVEESCKEIRNSKGLKAILCIILKLGNFLNASSSSSKSTHITGFRLSSLAKLKYTKTHDASSTLLHYLVQFIRREMCEYNEWYNDVKHVESVCKIEEKAVQQEMANMQQSMDKIQKEISYLSTVTTRNTLKYLTTSSLPTASDPSLQPFVSYATSFLHTSSPLLHCLSKRLCNLCDISHKLCRYFGEPSLGGWNDLFTLFNDFILDYKRANHEIVAGEEMVAEMERRKERERNLKAKIEERKREGSNSHAKREQKNAEDDFTSGEGFMFDSMMADTAPDQRRHTLCTVLPPASTSARTERTTLLSPRRPLTLRTGFRSENSNIASQLSVNKLALISPANNASTFLLPRTPLSPSTHHLLQRNTSLLSPTGKRAAPAGESMMSPSKMARIGNRKENM